jgi:hypothetical protein
VKNLVLNRASFLLLYTAADPEPLTDLALCAEATVRKAYILKGVAYAALGGATLKENEDP